MLSISLSLGGGGWWGNAAAAAVSLDEYVLLPVDALTDTDVNGWEEVIPTRLGWSSWFGAVNNRQMARMGGGRGEERGAEPKQKWGDEG